MLDVFWIRGIAGSEQPRSPDELQWLKRQGIRAILSLTEQPLPPAWLAGFETEHVPIPDMTAPSIGQLHACIAFLDRCRGARMTPLVHCRVGRGRTGTVLAAYLIAHGAPVHEAIAQVRRERPGAIETADQEAVLYLFEHALNAGRPPGLPA